MQPPVGGPPPASFPSPASPPPYGYRPPPPPAARPIGLWVLLSLLFGTVMGGSCATCAQLARGQNEEVFGGGGERVGVVELIGPIMDGDEVVRNLRDFAERDDLQAIVVRIDSPGGAVAPSQEIYQAMRFAAQKKPVVASMGSTAASGGFWASLGADWVFAQPGSITGSIGVIIQTPDLRGIASLLRFEMRTFKSGPLKDMGNPLREMTPADEALFMSLINDIYDQFVTLTAERRHLPMERVKELADGRIMTGRAAKEADLIDELGGLHDAALKAVAMAKAKKAQAEGLTTTTSTSSLKEPTLVYPKKPTPGLLQLLEGAASSGIKSGVRAAVESVREQENRGVELR
ncbi:MAG: signal peptide peptidase SppA [Deltaproteobacteria bacterium]|nr:signal peptide peptidase SppA [Deltaproteobacteria bacterium]